MLLLVGILSILSHAHLVSPFLLYYNTTLVRRGEWWRPVTCVYHGVAHLYDAWIYYFLLHCIRRLDAPTTIAAHAAVLLLHGDDVFLERHLTFALVATWAWRRRHAPIAFFRGPPMPTWTLPALLMALHVALTSHVRPCAVGMVVATLLTGASRDDTTHIRQRTPP